MPRRRFVEGIEQTRRVFAQLPEIYIERITHALNLGAREIAEEARSIVPVGTPPEHVRDTIRANPPKIKKGGKAVFVTVTAGDTKATAVSAFRSEFGRAPGGSGRAATHPGHRAQPFMFPAYWLKRQRVRGRIKREIRKAAREVARKR